MHLYEQWQGCCVLLHHGEIKHGVEQASIWAGLDGGSQGGGSLLGDRGGGTGCLLEEGEGVVDCPSSGRVAVRGQ